MSQGRQLPQGGGGGGAFPSCSRRGCGIPTTFETVRGAHLRSVLLRTRRGRILSGGHPRPENSAGGFKDAASSFRRCCSALITSWDGLRVERGRPETLAVPIAEIAVVIFADTDHQLRDEAPHRASVPIVPRVGQLPSRRWGASRQPRKGSQESVRSDQAEARAIRSLPSNAVREDRQFFDVLECWACPVDVVGQQRQCCHRAALLATAHHRATRRAALRRRYISSLTAPPPAPCAHRG